jgi:ATP-dependent Clp protease protease subunit
MPSSPQWKLDYKFKNATKDEASLFIYGYVVSEKCTETDVTADNFRQELDKVKNVKTLNIFINSGGGDVFQGVAIYNMLKRHKAYKKVYIDGLAASIASVIAMAGDKVFIPKNAMMMIHNPAALTVGNSDDFRKAAEDLDKITNSSIIPAYQEKSGMKTEKIKGLMNAESWINADDALGYGLIDEIEETKQIAASLQGKTLIMNGLKVDLSGYKNPPLAIGKNSFQQQTDQSRIERKIDLLNQRVAARKRKLI